MFFSPAVVAARSISLQVNAAANQFVTSFQTAANPQIVKKYAAKDYEGSKRLLLQTTKFSFYLMWLLCLPIFLGARPLLTIWLKTVPEYTVIFLQLVVIESLFCVFNTSFYRALYAKGRLKENALISPILGLIRFPVIYVLFKFGFSPVALSWASLITYALLGLVIKPILVIKIVNYSWKDIFSVFIPCLKVVVCSLPIPLFLYYKFGDESYVSFLVEIVVSVVFVITSSWFVGLERETRNILRNKVKAYLLKR